jgi:hypothetical protein
LEIFCGVLETKLFYNYQNEWLEKLEKLPKLRLYKNIKLHLSLHEYSNLLAQLRCGIFPIRIERGDIGEKL